LSKVFINREHDIYIDELETQMSQQANDGVASVSN
jgi:hypothetical protein